MFEGTVTELDEAPRFSSAALRRIARYHRWVVAAALAQIALWVGYLLLTLARGDSPSDGLGFPTILTFVIGAVAGIFVFLLYWTIRGPFPAFVMALGAIPPCIGLLVLIVVNATAVTVMKANDVDVTLFGADFDSIPEEIDELDVENETW